MKRLLTALTIVSTIGFALPTSAEPALVQKQRIATPTFPASLLRQYKAESAKPIIERELACEKGVTYRDWKVSEKLRFLEIAVSGKTSKFYPGWGKLETCTGRAALVYLSSTGHPGTWSSHTLITPEKPDARKQDIVQEYRGVGTPGRVLAKADQILQLPGKYYLRPAGERSYGDSRPLVLKENGTLETVTPPHYKDFSTMPPAAAGSLYEIDFYKLKDGFGVREEQRSSWYGPTWQCGIPCSPTPEQEAWEWQPITKYYRMRQGETSYREVDSLPIEEYGITFPIASFNEHDAGVYFNYNDYQNNRLVGYRVHAIDTDTLGVREGVVVSQTDERITFRYSLYSKSTGQTLQRWEGTIQK